MNHSQWKKIENNPMETKPKEEDEIYDKISLILMRLIDRIIKEREEAVAENEDLYGKLLRQANIIQELREDSERLANVTSSGVTEDGESYYVCPYASCDESGWNQSDIVHKEYCPITLHNKLMEKLDND